MFNNSLSQTPELGFRYRGPAPFKQLLKNLNVLLLFNREMLTHDRDRKPEPESSPELGKPKQASDD